MRWAPPGRDTERESGMSTLEVVLWAPFIVFVLITLAAFGMMVDAQGVVNSAAGDAARMGSLQHDAQAAKGQAVTVAGFDMTSLYCANGVDGKPAVDDRVNGVSTFAAGQLYRVTVTCTVNIFGLYQDTIVAVAVSPVDTYRETNP